MGTLADIQYVNLLKSLANRGYNLKSLGQDGFFLTLPTVVAGEAEEVFINRDSGSAQVVSGRNMGKSYSFNEVSKYVSQLPLGVPLLHNGSTTIRGISWDNFKKSMPHVSKNTSFLDTETLFQAFKGGNVDKGTVSSGSGPTIEIVEGKRYVDLNKELQNKYTKGFSEEFRKKKILVPEPTFQRIKDIPHDVAFTANKGTHKGYELVFDKANERFKYKPYSTDVPKEYGPKQETISALAKAANKPERLERAVNEITTSLKKDVFDKNPQIYNNAIMGAFPQFDIDQLGKFGIYLDGEVKDVLTSTTLGSKLLRSEYGLNKVSRYVSTTHAINTFTKNELVDGVIDKIVEKTHDRTSGNKAQFKKQIVDDMVDEFIENYHFKSSFASKRLSLSVSYQTMLMGSKLLPESYKSVDYNRVIGKAFESVGDDVGWKGSMFVETHTAAFDNKMADSVAKYYPKFISDMDKFYKSRFAPIDKARTIDYMNRGMMNMYQLDIVTRKLREAGYNRNTRVKMIDSISSSMFKSMERSMKHGKYSVSYSNVMDTALINQYTSKILSNNNITKYTDKIKGPHIINAVRSNMLIGMATFGVLAGLVEKAQEAITNRATAGDREAHSSKPTILRREGLSDFGSGRRPMSRRVSFQILDDIISGSMNATSNELMYGIRDYIQEGVKNYGHLPSFSENLDTIGNIEDDLMSALRWKEKKLGIVRRRYDGLFARRINEFKIHRQYKQYMKYYDDSVKTLFSKGRIDKFRRFPELKRFYKAKGDSVKSHLLGGKGLFGNKLLKGKVMNFITQPKTMALLALGAGIAVGVNLLAGTYKDKEAPRSTDVNIKEMQEYMMEQYGQSYRGNIIAGMQRTPNYTRNENRAKYTDFASPYAKFGWQTIKWARMIMSSNQYISKLSARGTKSAKKLSNIIFNSRQQTKRMMNKRKFGNKVIRSISSSGDEIKSVGDKDYLYGTYNEMIDRIGRRGFSGRKHNYHIKNMTNKSNLANTKIGKVKAENQKLNMQFRSSKSRLDRDAMDAIKIDNGLDDSFKSVYNDSRIIIDQHTNLKYSTDFNRPRRAIDLGYKEIAPRTRYRAVKGKSGSAGTVMIPSTKPFKSSVLSVNEGIQRKNYDIVYGIQRGTDRSKLDGLIDFTKEANITMKNHTVGGYLRNASSTLSKYYTTVMGDLRHSNATRFMYNPY